MENERQTKGKEPLAHKIGRGFVEKTARLYDGLEQASNGFKSVMEDVKNNKWIISYPILGNLSDSVQKRIEKATHGKYNPSDAEAISSFFNLAFYYPVAGALGGMNCSDKSEIAALFSGAAAGCGFFVGLYEGSQRVSRDRTHFDKGSIVGKLISLPIEAGLGIYDGVRKVSAKGGQR